MSASQTGGGVVGEVGDLTDAAAQDGDATASSLQALVKGVHDVLWDADGVAAFPAAAAAANAVSIAEVIRYIQEKQNPSIVTKATGSMASGFGTGDSPVTIFTVTGDILVRCIGAVTVNLTSTSNTGTISLGVSDNVAVLIPAATADGTELQAGDVWFDATSGTKAGSFADDGAYVAIAGGADIVMTIATNDITAGEISIYAQWIPLSSDGALVAA